MEAIAWLPLVGLGLGTALVAYYLLTMTLEGTARSAFKDDTVRKIHDLLPKTQCGQCDFDGCLPYAEAIALGRAPINRCPPGGTTTLKALSKLTDQPTPLLAAHLQPAKTNVVAWIDESLCIGCTKCIQACPVDAIMGASKRMHAIITDECNGCELCLPPCPTDCIHMVPADVPNLVSTRPANIDTYLTTPSAA